MLCLRGEQAFFFEHCPHWNVPVGLSKPPTILSVAAFHVSLTYPLILRERPVYIYEMATLLGCGEHAKEEGQAFVAK